ncbi:hypothetical protein [Mucilaginibacter sp. FT3.2]|uniref:hypothetical protein n=1 Tax=Mucilaginibacter sp. FT3.2 TaxID=2723090 RepID=UPI00161F26F7|nr:hypothetical protein [Mucilaginibacter sp. FT3.2]MBB6233233.1 hypothetical protein [Mucilaginibacter sp. FT3.2]
MSDYQSLNVIGFHSCDEVLGKSLLMGRSELRPSDNAWDWLGPGSYFWESDPSRALQYAIENATGIQKNKEAIKIPFVIGAIIELGNCLNLVEAESLEILGESYNGLKELHDTLGLPMPVNSEYNRALDCAVIKYIHESNKKIGRKAYDTIRCAFPEGIEAFPGSKITSKLHVQICVCNPDSIKGYFLPKPFEKYNPHLFKTVPLT